MIICRVYTFNVGQGLFNLVTGVTNDGSPYTAVFDCGNFGEYACLGEACTVLGQIKDFSQIDDVVISHQDIDHWRNFLDFMFMLNGQPNRKNQWYRFSSVKEDRMLFYNNQIIRRLVWGHNYGQDYVKENVYLHLNLCIDAQLTSQIFPFSRHWTITLNYSDIECQLSLNTSLSNKEQLSYKMTPSVPFLLPANGYVQHPYEIKEVFIKFANTVINNESLSGSICNIINTAFEKMLLDTSELSGITQSSYDLNISIRNLYLGGMDCEDGYMKFKQTAAFFADHMTEGESLLSIYPDSGEHVLRDSSLIDYAIMDNCDKFLSASGNVYKNATSIVSAFHLSETAFLLFPGDATIHTFRQLYTTLPPKQLLLLLSPHHGSYDTNCSFTVISDGRNRHAIEHTAQPLEELLNVFSPAVVVISALHNRYGHPSQFFLEMSDKYCQSPYATHKVIYCNNGYPKALRPKPAPSKPEKHKDVSKAVFSTESNSVNNYIAFPPPDTNSVRTERRTELPPDHLFL